MGQRPRRTLENRMETKQMKEARKGPKTLDNSKEVLNVLNKIERHLSTLVYYQGPSRGLGQSIEKYAPKPYVEGNKGSNVRP